MWSAIGLCGLCGCTTTGPCQRLFAWCQRDVRNEARLYDLHDPYPDCIAGPDTVTRPRDFVDPRTDSRRDYDLRLLLSMVGGPVPAGLATRAGQAGPYNSPISPALSVPETRRGPVARHPATVY